MADYAIVVDGIVPIHGGDIRVTLADGTSVVLPATEAKQKIPILVAEHSTEPWLSLRKQIGGT